MPICLQCGEQNPEENIVCRPCGALLGEWALDGVQTEVRTALEASVPIDRAVSFELIAAVVSCGIWYTLEQRAHQPLPFGLLVACCVPYAVLWGAGHKRAQVLGWISLGLTFSSIVGMTLVLAAADPAGFSTGLLNRLQVPFLFFYLLGLFTAYTIPAPLSQTRKVEKDKKPAQEGGTPVLRCIRCQTPTTEEESQPLPGQLGENRGAVLCPRCFVEIEATKLFPR